MEWDFSPDQVVRGDVGYRLSDFRYDLAREIRINLGYRDEAELAHTYNLAYDLCYALATGRSYEEFVGGHAFDPLVAELLEILREPMSVNAEMLGAVLQRLITDRMEAGMTLERALEDVADHHRRVIEELNPIGP